MSRSEHNTIKFKNKKSRKTRKDFTGALRDILDFQLLKDL